MYRLGRIAESLAAVGVAWLVAVSAAAGQGAIQREETLFVKEQQSFDPGYPVGNIAVGDPGVADFKVLAGRKELLLFGRGPGKTTLTIWDQKNVKRHEILLVVITREEFEKERDLKALLQPYHVDVRKLGANLVVSGTVDTKGDFDAIAQIAAAAGVQNLVRLATTGVPTTPMPTPTGTPTVGTSAKAPAGPFTVHYEVELFEASIGYQSGSYGTGVEPSGRSLFKHTIDVVAGAEQEVYIPGTVATGKAGADKKVSTTGLRLKVRPGEVGADGAFSTYILVETNLPVGNGTYDATVWRRARWEFSGMSGEPLGLAGNELLATAVVAERRGSKLGRIVGTVTGLGGIAGAPGMEYGSAVPYFDKDKKTQLLVVLRPRLSNAGR
ncbi:MAG: pilus assembly protein N-terminal domain-containing protein [Vicinamibacterales bacterium]